MFWRFGGYASISAIDSILDRSEFSLEELLDEGDLLQEVKQGNSKLIEYLRQNHILEKLLDYIVAPKLDTESRNEHGAASGPPLEDLTGADLDLLESMGMSGVYTTILSRHELLPAV